MKKRKAVRSICGILAAIFFLVFFLALLWYMRGSFEVVPTEEQQEKVQIVTMVLMIITGIPCIICTVIGITYKPNSEQLQI